MHADKWNAQCRLLCTAQKKISKLFPLPSRTNKRLNMYSKKNLLKKMWLKKSFIFPFDTDCCAEKLLKLEYSAVNLHINL